MNHQASIDPPSIPVDFAPTPWSKRDWITAVATILVLATTATLLFSWAGFNPTDEGFFLAYGRRILRGDVPHRDFIFIRPIGSILLHLPEVRFGGPYTFWITRTIVWLQFAAIAWLWMIILRKLLASSQSVVDDVLLTILAFVAGSHVFPAMAWNTIDGLFLLSLGLAILLSNQRFGHVLGYCIMGCAYLCKQNFALYPFAILFLFGHYKRFVCWIAAVAPGCLYLAILALCGALDDFLVDIVTLTDFTNEGFWRYVLSPWTYGGLFLGITAGCLLRANTPRALGASVLTCRFPWLASLGLLLTIFTAAFALAELARVGMRHSPWYIWGALYSFLLFGAVVGLTAASFLFDVHKRLIWRAAIAVLLFAWSASIFWGFLYGLLLSGAVVGLTAASFLFDVHKRLIWRAAIAVLLFAWSASISWGYNSPALGSGPLLLFLLMYAFTVASSQPAASQRRLAPAVKRTMVYFALSVLSLVAFGVARAHILYREAPLRDLKFPLGEVFPGMRLIYTNQKTYEVLVDLQKAIQRCQGKRFAILPDYAAYWVASDHINPLLLDWPIQFEMNSDALVKRFRTHLSGLRGSTRFIVAKIRVDLLASALRNINISDDNSYYPVVGFIRRQFSKVDETDFFEIYE